MKKILLFCIVGLIGIGTNSYATDFDEVGIGAVSTPLNSMLNIVHNESIQTYHGATGTVTVENGGNFAASNGNTLFAKEILVGDSIVITTEPSVRHTVTLVSGDTGIITFTPNYEGPTYADAAILVSRPVLLIDNDEAANLLTVSRGGRVGIGKFPSSYALLTVNSGIQFGSSAPGTNATSVLCWTNLGTIGRCTNAPNSSGKCNCTQIN
jgi:hypothetical protein